MYSRWAGRSLIRNATLMKKIVVRVRRALVALIWTITLLTPTAFGIAVYADLAPTKVVAGEPHIVQASAPVLDRIADCESGSGKPGSGHQFTTSGDVVTNSNQNGTVDVGKYQINLNAAHVREMAKLGFNPLTEEGNEAYAHFLYANRGTTDWSSSQRCWSR